MSKPKPTPLRAERDRRRRRGRRRASRSASDAPWDRARGLGGRGGVAKNDLVGDRGAIVAAARLRGVDPARLKSIAAGPALAASAREARPSDARIRRGQLAWIDAATLVRAGDADARSSPAPMSRTSSRARGARPDGGEVPRSHGTSAGAPRRTPGDDGVLVRSSTSYHDAPRSRTSRAITYGSGQAVFWAAGSSRDRPGRAPPWTVAS